MPAAAPQIDVVHNAPGQRFEARVDGALAYAAYRAEPGVLRMIHTDVPPHLEGRGIAGELVRVALQYARDHGLKVIPACSYVRGYMRKRPETLDLLPPGVSL